MGAGGLVVYKSGDKVLHFPDISAQYFIGDQGIGPALLKGNHFGQFKLLDAFFVGKVCSPGIVLHGVAAKSGVVEIGRASCLERVYIKVVALS